jgi:hypothetical protein
MSERNASLMGDAAGDPGPPRHAAAGAALAPWDFGVSAFAAMLDAAFGPLLSAKPWPAAMEVVPRGAAAPAEMAPLIARALLATAASGLRTWQDLAQVHSAHQLTLLQPLLVGFGYRAAAETARHQADGLRAWLREMGDVPLREARRLQAEMEALGEAVAQGIEPPDTLGPHRRRWRPKP